MATSYSFSVSFVTHRQKHLLCYEDVFPFSFSSVLWNKIFPFLIFSLIQLYPFTFAKSCMNCDYKNFLYSGIKFHCHTQIWLLITLVKVGVHDSALKKRLGNHQCVPRRKPLLTKRTQRLVDYRLDFWVNRMRNTFWKMCSVLHLRFMKRTSYGK